VITIFIGILVALSILFLGLSIEVVLGNSNPAAHAAGPDSLDIDLSGFEPPAADPVVNRIPSPAQQRSRLNKSAMTAVNRELRREIQKLDTSEVDFDLSEITGDQQF